MADDLDDLQRLAPAVDADRASAAFRHRRRRSRSVRRGATAAAAVMVLVAGTVAVLASADDDTPVTAGPGEGEPTGPVSFEVLVVVEASDEMGTLRAAVDEQGYADLWRFANPGAPRPPIDFEEKVVVSITIPDNACPPELTEFERVADVLTPVFVEPEGGCEDPLIPKTYVVALDRAPLGRAFTLRLPADEVYGFEEQRLLVELGGEPAGEAPTVWAQEPSPSADGMAALVMGTVQYDTGNGCFSIELEGLAYPVVWPAGTVGTADGPGVVLPDGDIARVGDEVYGGGGYLDVAEDYGIPDVCVPSTGEVAVYNPNEDVEVTGSVGGAESSTRVTGTFIASGGPHGAADTALSGTITATEYYGETTTAVATDGAFALELPEGTYTFSGTSPQYQGINPTCGAAAPVRVEGNATVSVEVVCVRR